ncbi:MAG: hypothetical protein E7241_11240 [Lachnospiraceae bacterium]|nr:hypothetical protein [Lachnospiraceae bacterium]
MRELSIFVDESGDFGAYAKHSPYYIITMIFHDQSQDIAYDITKLKEEFVNLGYENDFVVHTGPLIRKEEIYCNMLPNDRRAIFTKLFFFALKANIMYKTFVFEKKQYGESLKMEARMAREISLFLRKNLSFFQEFDNVILYYDNGQKQITRILNNVLATELTEYDVRQVLPKDYKLFQAADLICTLKLLDVKCKNGGLTKSEMAVFHSKRDLNKQFIKPIKKKEFYKE